MNTRIKQLADRAKEQSDEFDSIRHKLTDKEWEEIYNEKFAELLILECAKVCENVTKPGQTLHLLSIGYSQCIKEHFGIKND